MFKSPVLLLYTDWSWDYWAKDGEAPFPSRSYKELPDWNELKARLPLPALGVYAKMKQNDFRLLEFSYLVVQGMEYDVRGIPKFQYSYKAKSKTKSEVLLRQFASRNFFEARESDAVLRLLRDLGEQPPQEWLDLIDVGKALPSIESWREWIGQHFLLLSNTEISNEDFEDVTVDVFRALGFEVNQMGHKRPGSFPDGTLTASLSDFAIVYDCKNRSDYYPPEDDKRALLAYTQKEGRRLQEQNNRIRSVYSMFVAKSLAQEELSGADVFISADDFLYALYKRVRLGKDFALTAFDEAAKRNGRMDKRFMDQEWPEFSVA